MSRHTLGLIALVTVFSFAPAGAAPAPHPAGPRVSQRSAIDRLQERALVAARVENGALTYSTRGPLRDALHEANNATKLDAPTLARIEGAALRAHGRDVTDLTEVIATAAAEGTSLVHVALGTGRFDGDGRDDVLEAEIAFDGETYETLSVSLVAHRGADGTEIWRAALSAEDLYAFPAGDLTGDGLTDIALIALHFESSADGGDCAITACAFAGAQSYEWTLHTIGGNGAPGWSASYPGSFAEVFAATGAGAFVADGFSYADVFLARNFAVDVWTSGDHDGDGHADMVIDQIDVLFGFAEADAFTLAGGAFSYSRVLATRTIGSVLKGSTGVATYTREGDLVAGFNYLSPVGNATGSAALDLLWEELRIDQGPAGCAFVIVLDGACTDRVVPAGDTAEVVDGESHATAWRIERPEAVYGFYFPLGDLNGDGFDDLTLWTFVDEETSSAISGKNGAELWRKPGLILSVLGTHGGAPVALLTLFAFTETGITATQDRVDGPTGTTIASATHGVDAGDGWDIFTYLEVWIAPDFDTDGVMEPVAQAFTFGGAESSQLWIDSGAQDHAVFERSLDRFEAAFGPGDGDGDGNTDFIDFRDVLHRSSYELHIGTLALDGNVTPAFSTHLFNTGPLYVTPASDLDGDGADDMLLDGYQTTAEGAFESTLFVHDRHAGPLWSVGDVLTQAPAPATGGIAGTVTAGGAPFTGACLEVYEDGVYIDFSFAHANGTYLVPELPDGEYNVFFWDCFGTNGSEWYDDAQDESGATPVVVSGGAITTGIDADLEPGEPA